MLYNYDNDNLRELRIRLMAVKRAYGEDPAGRLKRVKAKIEYIEYLITKKEIEKLQKEIKEKTDECLRLTSELERNKIHAEMRGQHSTTGL